MMKRAGLFGLVTFFLGWTLQILTLRFLHVGWASPQLVLLAVLALAVRGRTNLAQTLGFFWGLALDVYGLGLFGSQALLLVLVGHVASRLSRQLNGEKLVTQEALAFFGSLFFGVGLAMVDHIFRAPSHVSTMSVSVFLLNILMNAVAAPLVFWVMDRWTHFWAMLEVGKLDV